jgi:hypothetical protein
MQRGRSGPVSGLLRNGGRTSYLSQPIPSEQMPSEQMPSEQMPSEQMPW